jgi:hypothetical protein
MVFQEALVVEKHKLRADLFLINQLEEFRIPMQSSEWRSYPISHDSFGFLNSSICPQSFK